MRSSGLQNAVIFEVIRVMPAEDHLARPSTCLFYEFGAFWEPNGPPLGVPGGPPIRHCEHLWTPEETFGTTWGSLSLPKGSRAPKLVPNRVRNQARCEPPGSSLGGECSASFLLDWLLPQAPWRDPHGHAHPKTTKPSRGARRGRSVLQTIQV